MGVGSGDVDGGGSGRRILQGREVLVFLCRGVVSSGR